VDVLGLLGQGFGVALEPLNLFLAFIGVLLGTVIGMLPGIGPINAIAILIPITFSLGLPVTSAMIMFAGIYYGSMYGNSISSILLNVPGTAASVVTALDGFPMAQKGRGGPALAMSAIASFVGGTLSIFALIFFAPLLARWAINFGPAEYFVLMIFAFSTLSSLTGDNVFKALISACFGLMLSTVGLDPQGTTTRFTYGQLQLYDGMDFVVVAIGLFAISEVLQSLLDKAGDEGTTTSYGRVFISLKEFMDSLGTMLRSSLSGFLIGVLPGAGATIASFVAYTTEKQLIDHNDEFGKGDIRGVAAPEAANNAASVGAFIPMLTLGVPGSGTTAVILAALLSFGVTPGPLLIQNNPEIFWSLAASMYIGNVMLLILNLPLVGLFVRILLVPRYVLMPLVATLSFVGVYAVNGSAFDLWLMTGFGLIGFVMRKLGLPLAPVILGLVLGALMEVNLRRALVYSRGSWQVFFESPISIGLWILTLVGLILPIVIRRVVKQRSAKPLEGGA
jgi:putative tricarboxylic transport membrane protein